MLTKVYHEGFDISSIAKFIIEDNSEETLSYLRKSAEMLAEKIKMFKENFDKEIPLDIAFGMTRVDGPWFGYLRRTTGKTYKLPYKFNISKPLTQLKTANFGEN